MTLPVPTPGSNSVRELGEAEHSARATHLAFMAETVSKITGLPADVVVPDADLVDDLCVDSVAKIELMVACEARYGIQVPDEVVSRFSTVRSVLDYLVGTGS